MAVEIVVADSDAHAGLLHAVFAESDAPQHAFLAKSAITIVHEEQTGSGVTGDVDVLPAVFIKIGGDDRHAVGGWGVVDAGFLSYVSEGPVAVVAIEGMLTGGQAARSAFDGNTFRAAVGIFARSGSVFERKTDVVGNKQIEMAVAIVIHERATSAKPRLVTQKTSGFGDVGESAVAVVAVKRVLAEVGAKNVLEAIVVEVADADSASPADRMQTGFFGDVGECTVAVIFVEAIGGALGSAAEASAGENEQIHPAVIIVIDESAAASGGFDDVLFDFEVAVNYRSAESGGGGDVHEAGVEGTPGRSGPWQGFDGVSGNALAK